MILPTDMSALYAETAVRSVAHEIERLPIDRGQAQMLLERLNIVASELTALREHLKPTVCGAIDQPDGTAEIVSLSAARHRLRHQ